jgi:uroporphyrinogen-III synthase
MSSRDQPLAGRRILVTRAPHQASELADRLRTCGAEPILVPTIEIGPPSSYASLDEALAQLPTFNLIAFTSANAVTAFGERARDVGVAPKPKRIAAVGPSTATALESVGLRADVIPPVYTAESLGETLRLEASGRDMLLVLAEDAPHILRDALTAAGARVRVAAAYSNRIPAASLAMIRELFANESRRPDAITFTSTSTARNLIALLNKAGVPLPQAIVRASIGPITTRALVELSLPPQIEAREATMASLVDALAAHFSAHASPNRR